MSFRIVPAGPSHAALIAALHGACFDDPWDEKSILSLLSVPGTTGWVATDNKEEPLGFLLFRTAADEAEIISIGVVTEARRKNVARQMLDTATERSRQAGVTKIFLEVARDNRAAIHFYEKAGFVPVGVRERYYVRPDGPVDALIYRREITLK